jgi:hypothetical protein
MVNHFFFTNHEYKTDSRVQDLHSSNLLHVNQINFLRKYHRMTRHQKDSRRKKLGYSHF